MAPLIMDMDGELMWNGPTTHAFAFGTQVYNNEPVLVWWNGSLYPESIGRGNGVVHMLNQQYTSIRNTTLAACSSQPTNVTQADLTSVGGPADGWVVAALVFEIDIATNTVLFSWNSLDHLDQLPFTDSLYQIGSESYAGDNQTVAWGYFHINSVAPYDGGHLISSRFLCSAIAIADDGSVKWRLQGRDGGEFTLGNGTDFCYQHDIRAIPEQPSSNFSVITLHMHENHNSPIDNGTVPSSGKSLFIDLGSRHVTLKHRYLNESEPIYSSAQGNYQPLADGNVFIGHGWIPVLEEFSHTGEILTTIQFATAEARPGGGILSAKAPTLSYRAFKQPWVGCPRTRPDVVAEAAANGSWNGATEVEAWEIYAGNSPELACVDTLPKAGFETAALIASASYVQVRPKLRQHDHGRTRCEAVASEVITM